MGGDAKAEGACERGDMWRVIYGSWIMKPRVFTRIFDTCFANLSYYAIMYLIMVASMSVRGWAGIMSNLA